MILQRSRNSSRGVTLIELVITIVIISVALVASLSSFSVITGRNSNVLVQSRALDLAQLYMDEVLSKNFDEATGSGGAPTYTGNCRITDDGESRDNYDDVDDFNFKWTSKIRKQGSGNLWFLGVGTSDVSVNYISTFLKN